ncbi:terminase [Acidobacteria bacterium ACD]|nr:MAG: terminase [Acidobacteriota bacterium]MCE7957624.1 terminase [Acidobacteria bacterium ACB2]MDL1948340.1 terminase [Acidobacteria bacterium ACD]
MSWSLDSVTSWPLEKRRRLSALLIRNRPAATDLFREAGLAPDPWQRDVLLSRAPRTLLLCSRQSGKSTTTACLALFEAIHRAPALVLLLSPSLRQSGELFRKVLDFYRALPSPPRSVGESALRLELENGSRIVSLPGTEETIRGYSGVSLLAVDEAARVPDSLYFSVRPMLAVSGGRLLALSTPFGKRGWYFDAWQGSDPWERVRITAYDCPRIPADFLAEERRAMPASWFAAEYEATFTEAEGQFFREEDIARALAGDVAPLFPAEPVLPAPLLLGPEAR